MKNIRISNKQNKNFLFLLENCLCIISKFKQIFCLVYNLTFIINFKWDIDWIYMNKLCYLLLMGLINDINEINLFKLFFVKGVKLIKILKINLIKI